MSADIPYILCVAHSYPHKQVHLLVEAFGIVEGRIPHHLVLIGKPRRGEVKLQESLERLPDKSKVHRISNLQYSELQGIYQKADLFVLPSVYEGFGLPILEAMLAGIPVITTNKASLPEVGGTHVVYVQECSSEKLSYAILDVISMDEKSRKTTLKDAHDWAASFTWQKSATRTYEVLAGLIK